MDPMSPRPTVVQYTKTRVPSAVAIEPIEPDVSTTSTMSEGTRAPASGCAAEEQKRRNKNEKQGVDRVNETQWAVGAVGVDNLTKKEQSSGFKLHT